MLAVIEITPWHWAGFIAAVLVFVALDLFVFHRETQAVTFRNALLWTAFFFILAMLFGAVLVPLRGRQEAMEFLAGYVIELSLSMDNVFVIALIFAYFRVPTAYQHRVLFFGFIDALILRGAMIALGTALISRFHWILYLLGAFLIYTGIKMLFTKEEGVHPEKNPVIKVAQCIFPVSSNFVGVKFFTRVDGRRALTPLALVLLMVETADLIFALDSIPAILVVTTKPFIIFTSNIFAILGLRSLYFVLVGAIEFFRYLKFGLALVLVFIGAKMAAEIWHITIPTGLSLGIVGGILLITAAASILLVNRESHGPEAKKQPPPAA